MNPSPRLHRWVSASFAAAPDERYMPVTIQGLGRLDHDLYAFDRQLLSATGVLHSDGDEGALSYHITLSYLWVLGAYEVIRAMKQRKWGANKDDQALVHLLRKYERIRMPLAKFEPARRHENTDSKIAYPVLNSEHGVGWQVAPEVFISRGELSDAFLSWLESRRTSTSA